jgi:integrase
MASITKRDGRANLWQVRYRDPEGKSRSRQFARKVDAERFLTSVQHSLLAGDYIDPADRTTFQEYAEGWRAAQVHRDSSAAVVERHLRLRAYPAFGSRPLRSIRPSEIQAWVKALSVTLAPATVAVAHGVVAAVFKAAIRDRLIASSPCEGSKLPEDHQEPVVPLETAQVLALEVALPPRFRALVPLGAAAGPRISEATGLTVDRSGLMPPSTRPSMRIDRQLVVPDRGEPYLGPPKRKASRRAIPLPRVAVEALAAHLAAFPPKPRTMTCLDEAGRTWTETVELMFTTEDGEPIRRNALSRVWRPAVDAAGLPAGTTYHDLRHYYASLLIRHAESVKTVQARLGHATAVETLDTYAHLWPDSEDRTREAVDSVFGAAVSSRAPAVHQDSG